MSDSTQPPSSKRARITELDAITTEANRLSARLSSLMEKIEDGETELLHKPTHAATEAAAAAAATEAATEAATPDTVNVFVAMLCSDNDNKFFTVKVPRSIIPDWCLLDGKTRHMGMCSDDVWWTCTDADWVVSDERKAELLDLERAVGFRYNEGESGAQFGLRLDELQCGGVGDMSSTRLFFEHWNV